MNIKEMSEDQIQDRIKEILSTLKSGELSPFYKEELTIEYNALIVAGNELHGEDTEDVNLDELNQHYQSIENTFPGRLADEQHEDAIDKHYSKHDRDIKTDKLY